VRCSYACCGSSTKLAATAPSFRIVLVRCLFPRPRAGGVVDGGGGGEGEKVRARAGGVKKCGWYKSNCRFESWKKGLYLVASFIVKKPFN
jgi:hypothetical protein